MACRLGRARAARPRALTRPRTRPGSVELNGNPIADDGSESYRIVTNNFLSDGGDGFPTFEDGTAKYFGGLDIDAFSDYLSANSPYTPGDLDRVIDATP